MNLVESIRSLMPVEPQTLDVVTERTNKRMKAFIISLVNDHESTVSTRKLITSINSTQSNIQPFISPAINPGNLDQQKEFLFGKSVVPNIQWTYPTQPGETRYDIRTGLQLSSYPTKDIRKRISCTLSHYNLWLHCYKIDEPIMILEQDAIFTRQFEYSSVQPKFTGDILGLNSPVGATRKAAVYDKTMLNSFNTKYDKLPKKPNAAVFDAPWIDDRMIPQGIAGNSAYIIKPEGAAKLISLTAENGLWPNDAIMCKQLMPGKLQQVYPYYTKVQGNQSTTSL